MIGPLTGLLKRLSAWIGVVEHPYYAVTDASGKYSLPALPPGPYRIEAWQEFCEPVSFEPIEQIGQAIGTQDQVQVGVRISAA